MYRNKNKRIEYIKEHIKRLSVKYKKYPFLTYIKILFYTVKALFVITFPPRIPNNKNIYIAFIIEGGLGDFLITINFIHCLLEKIYKPNLFIDIITNNKNFAQSLVPDLPGLRNVIIRKNLKTKKYYDLEIKIIRRPYILSLNESRINKFAPQLIKFIDAYKQKEQKFFVLFDNAPYLEGVADILDAAENKVRYNQADVNNLLNIDDTFKAEIKIKNEQETLQKFNLKNKTYITVSREVGYDRYIESTKLWPLQNYRELTKQIKQAFPNIIIVEIGAGKGKRITRNIDINLAGKTTLEEGKSFI